MTPMACEIPPTGAARSIAQSLATLVPVLQTARLTMRAPRVDDFPAYAEVACTERGAGIGGPMSRDDAWFDFVQLASGWMLHGHGGWTIEDNHTGQPLGFVLIGLEPGDQEPELGFLVSAEAEGNGIAFEAAQAAMVFATKTLKRRTLVSYIHPANTRSIRLAERLGAYLDGEITDESSTTLIYRHILSETH